MINYIYILITIILFSTIEVVIKLLAGSIDVIFLSFLRFFISGILFLIIDFKKFKLLEKKDFFNLLIISIIGITIGFSCFNISLKSTNASNAAVIFSINPIFSAIFAIYFYKEKFTLNKIIGLIFGFIGVWILNFGFGIITFNKLIGPILTLISAITFAFYITSCKKYNLKYGAIFTTGLTFTLGSIFYLPFINNFEIINFSKNIFYILYLSIFTTGIAYLCYFQGLKYLSIIVGTSLFYLKPIIATFLAIIFLNENIDINFVIGIIIILFSLLITLNNKLFLKLQLNKI
ncbi:MAG: hypothetical protein PWP46_798 [Fusobacteriaceae bacterium]|jgi:drug/metabolite transporter (DMT)-like permease|nr:hypothetical protein [Fusobacteriaceae bacterium]